MAAKSVLVDAGFLIALLSRRDRHHDWAAVQVQALPQPWLTCDAVLSESFHLLGPAGRPGLDQLIRRGVVMSRFSFQDELKRVLDLMRKYRSVPMSLADACMVRMAEILADSLLVTTDGDFRVYRRHGRQVIPALMP